MFIITLFHFIKLYFVYAFSLNKGSKSYQASYNLFQKSFRVPEKNSQEFWLVFTKYFSLLVHAKKNKQPFCINIFDSKIFIYDLSFNQFVARERFVQTYISEEINGGIFKNNLLYNQSLIALYMKAFICFPFIVLLFLHSLHKKDKAPYALVFQEIIENANLLNLTKKFNIKKLYFFSIYEKDSNAITLLLQKRNINVFKIPSDTPLSFWNKIIIANTLVICSGYQYDELEEYKDTMFVNETVFWGPEQSHLNISKYSNSVPTQKNTIGFYSTGAWIRKLENHANQGYDLHSAEEKVKEILKDYCSQHIQYELLVFLHPRERSKKYFEQTVKKYQNDFENITYKLIDASEETSSNSFEQADLGISFHSTIIYERLHYGFKTLFMPLGIERFPLSESGLKNICIMHPNDLHKAIENAISITNVAFFEKNRITSFAKFIYN
jgi:hypothetical protein